MARPPPAPIADPISAFRPRWPLRFTWTVLISARDSVSWLAAALIASASGIAFSRLPRTVLPPERATRISVPGATWLRLAHPSGDAGGWDGAFPARPANSNTTILNFIIGLIIESGLSPGGRPVTNHTTRWGEVRPGLEAELTRGKSTTH